MKPDFIEACDAVYQAAITIESIMSTYCTVTGHEGRHYVIDFEDISSDDGKIIYGITLALTCGDDRNPNDFLNVTVSQNPEAGTFVYNVIRHGPNGPIVSGGLLSNDAIDVLVLDFVQSRTPEIIDAMARNVARKFDIN